MSILDIGRSCNADMTVLTRFSFLLQFFESPKYNRKGFFFYAYFSLPPSSYFLVFILTFAFCFQSRPPYATSTFLNSVL